MRFARNISLWSEMKPALYHGHLAYVDFTRSVFVRYFNSIAREMDLHFLGVVRSAYIAILDKLSTLIKQYNLILVKVQGRCTFGEETVGVAESNVSISRDGRILSTLLGLAVSVLAISGDNDSSQ